MEAPENGRPSGVAGVGIDLVAVAEIRELDERTGGAFTERTFTEEERRAAEKAPDPWEFYAGRYAVKEAVFKAIAPRCREPFDFRRIETVNEPSGRPCVVMTPELRRVCAGARVSGILVSISHAGGLAAAIAEATEEP